MLLLLCACLDSAVCGGRAVVEINQDQDGVYCFDLDDPGTCCPDGFEWVGWYSYYVVCLEGEVE